MAEPRNMVITGGSSGLGLALARACVLRGDRVALLARDAAKLDSAAAELKVLRPGARVMVAATDVQSEAGLSRAFEAVAVKFLPPKTRPTGCAAPWWNPLPISSRATTGRRC